ncbi:LOW QUALITY PROTEIN: leucine-rich repeat-containing protein 15-like [Lingula anatina]|uniref:LOW QUALITY PROTEIN: leucine-rich repeat-containing protein 15-like n=1 Tax=Lingula anatina TaxID=7574 RepID=A0A1S3JPQ0_LINAN|nr:LOW QUALITY PROTEIN: leucine-rich repeat-containing protein 15-like [Lingula anatina]|eukprot:XP_013412111.1 LOW QUALITY PROTEIN: leucine-rich repeat-containing protein 15-like [Lingula anatina]
MKGSSFYWLLIVLLGLAWNLNEVNGLCSRKCPCMANRAYCNGMYLKEIPDDFLPTLTHLDVHNNLITNLTRASLAHLTRLQTLMLASNRISSIEDGIFANFRNLAGMDLSKNKLEKLPRGMFRGARSLQAITLANNALVDVEGLFRGLRRITILNLKYNNLQTITEKTFIENIRLRYLDLSHNDISAIDSNAFRNLRRLRYLKLNNNPLTDLMSLKFDSSKLSLIDLEFCQLGQVVEGLPKSLQDIRMGHNNIRYISANDFRQNTRLSKLNLANNSLEYIHNEAFRHMRQLQELWLNKNYLSLLPKRIPSRLRILHLEENNIYNIPENIFRHHWSLSSLYLQKNRIKKITKRTFKGSNLRNLDLEKNSIAQIEVRAFAGMSRLQSLDLSDNPTLVLDPMALDELSGLIMLKIRNLDKLDYVPSGLFKDMKSLRFLDLTGSPLIVAKMLSWDLNAGYFNTLTDLNLMNTGLSRLPVHFPDYLPKLRSITLTGNPWYCDSDIVWMRRWMYTPGLNVYMRWEIKCALPLKFKGAQLNQLSELDLAQIDPIVQSQSRTHTDEIPIGLNNTKSYPQYPYNLVSKKTETSKERTENTIDKKSEW